MLKLLKYDTFLEFSHFCQWVDNYPVHMFCNVWQYTICKLCYVTNYTPNTYQFVQWNSPSSNTQPQKCNQSYERHELQKIYIGGIKIQYRHPYMYNHVLGFWHWLDLFLNICFSFKMIYFQILDTWKSQNELFDKHWHNIKILNFCWLRINW